MNPKNLHAAQIAIVPIVVAAWIMWRYNKEMKALQNPSNAISGDDIIDFDLTLNHG